jgi:hypothetical protein
MSFTHNNYTKLKLAHPCETKEEIKWEAFTLNHNLTSDGLIGNHRKQVIKFKTGMKLLSATIDIACLQKLQQISGLRMFVLSTK